MSHHNMTISIDFRIGKIMSSSIDGRMTEKITNSCRPSTVHEAYENLRMQTCSQFREYMKNPANVNRDVWPIVMNEIICSLMQVYYFS